MSVSLPRRLILALIQAWRRRQRQAADRVLLQGMDERELRDLGLGRSAIEHVTHAGTDDRPRDARSV
jgi:uncharacterized protein YjiS (DUF1127 family)